MNPMNCLFIFFLIFVVESHKILVYQTAPAESHVQFSGKLVDVLVEAGHVVDHLIIEWNNVKTNGTIQANRIRRFTLAKSSPWLSMPHMNGPFDDKTYTIADSEPIFYRKTLIEFCDAMLSDKSLLEWIKDGKYDAALSSAYDGCGIGLFYLAGIRPVFVYSATPIIDHWSMILGIPNFASFIPNALRNNGEGDQMTAFQKLSVLTDRIHQQQIVLPSYHAVQTQVFQKHFGENFPSITELSKRISAIFVNSHPLLELQRPYSHKIKQIGGITLRKIKKLDLKIEKILNSAKLGTILFSFGSLTRAADIPEPILKIFVDTFKLFPDFNIIWKFEENRPDLFENVTNIFPLKWIQQRELLDDDRVKLFISHTGLNSLLEASHSGTPVLSIPLFLDQNYNAQVLEKRGVSIRLDKKKLSKIVLFQSISTLLKNENFIKNAKTLQKMLQKYPQKSEETLLSWIDFGTEFKETEKYFSLESSNMNIFEYFCLDAILLLFGFSFIFLVVVYICISVLSKLLAIRLKIKIE